MKIAKAAAFAAQKHHGQFRKDGTTPYFYHCAMVAYLVQKHCAGQNYYNIEDMVCAAFLHDTVEDCDVSIEDIEQEFGPIVAGYVCGLTNVYTKEKYPNMNRAARKKAENLRLKNLSLQVKQIKLADRLANVIDLSSLEIGFKEKFVNETYSLLDSIGDAHPNMVDMIRKKLIE